MTSKSSLFSDRLYLGAHNLSEKDTADGKLRLALYRDHKPYHAEK
jgi:hypothetical protein